MLYYERIYFKCFDEERYVQLFILENSDGENEYK